MERLGIALAGLLLFGLPVYAQPDSYPIPTQAKFIELEGVKYPVPPEATGMRVDTEFVKPSERKPGVTYRSLPNGATSWRGNKVPPGATHYRSVLKFTRKKKRGIADVLDDKKAEGTYEVEVPVNPPGTQPTPPADATPPADPKPPTAMPPTNKPPASKPPASNPPPTRPKPPTIRQVVVQVDY